VNGGGLHYSAEGGGLMGEFLHIGDLVTLNDGSSSTGGFVFSSGFLDQRVSVEASDGIAANHPREAFFVIDVQQNYMVEREARAALERKGMTHEEAMSARGRADKDISRLVQEMAREKKTNQQEISAAVGRDVRYGMVIQLRHVISDKYLSVSRKSPEQNRDGKRIEVQKYAGEFAYFRILPRLRVHVEGERVHVGDPVVLEHCESSLRLTFGLPRTTSKVGGATVVTKQREVCATKDASGVNVNLHRSHKHHQQRQHLTGATPVRLVHSEAEGTMHCAPGSSEVHITVNDAVKHSSNAVWEVCDSCLHAPARLIASSQCAPGCPTTDVHDASSSVPVFYSSFDLRPCRWLCSSIVVTDRVLLWLLATATFLLLMTLSACCMSHLAKCWQWTWMCPSRILRSRWKL
jgi:hypothetical protein